MDIEYINGEANVFKTGDELKFFNHTLPKVARFHYPEKWNIATFDENEIVAAFEKVTQNNPEAEVVVTAKVQFMYKGVQFIVKCGDQEVPLEKVVVRAGGYN